MLASVRLLCHLGSINPCPKAVHMETFYSSVFKIHVWISATATKIYTTHGSNSADAQCPLQYDDPPTHYCTMFFASDWVSIARCSAIHFRGQSIRQVSCYTLLSGFQLPWPPSCCQNEPTPFLVSDTRTIGLLNPLSGSSLIASSAYQKRPTWYVHWTQKFT